MSNTKKQKADAKRIERKHACPNCDARFPFPNKLRMHVLSHHSLANACEICPERFNRFNELRTHMRHAHQIVHQCHLCAYSSSVKTEVKKHIVKCHENGVRCTVDGCTATVAYNRLRRHIREVHCSSDQGSLQSSLIEEDETTGDFPESEEDLSQDSKDIKSSCSTSGETIAASNSSEEKFVVIGEDAFEEEEEVQDCLSTTAAILPQNTEGVADVPPNVEHGESVVESTGNSDSGEVIQKQTDEPRSANQKQSLNLSDKAQNIVEMKDLTTSGEEPFFVYTEAGEYACQKCGKIFCDMNNSRRHFSRVHLKSYVEKTRLKKYVCKFSACAQRFSCPSKLQDHLSIAHNGEIPFVCETCNKKFRSRAQFAVHLKRYHLVSIRDVPSGFTDGAGDSFRSDATIPNTVVEKKTVIEEDVSKEESSILKNDSIKEEVVPTFS